MQIGKIASETSDKKAVFILFYTCFETALTRN